MLRKCLKYDPACKRQPAPIRLCRAKQKQIINAFFETIIENLPTDEPEAEDQSQIESYINEHINHFLQDLRYVFNHDAYAQVREWRIVKIDNQNYLTPDFFE